MNATTAYETRTRDLQIMVGFSSKETYQLTQQKNYLLKKSEQANTIKQWFARGLGQVIHYCGYIYIYRKRESLKCES